MNVGSLFSGIGGLDLGLERAGMTIRWQVEIDDFCGRVLAKHWPDVPRYGDIRDLRGDELEAVDLVCGGFPCQDISNAGRRAGITGTRSGLWREMVRTVRMVRPRFVLVENVAALLGRGMGTVLGDLAEGGYDSEWDCLPACALGAPHRRDRVFVVAHSPSLRREGVPAFTRSPGASAEEGRLREPAGSGKDVADATFGTAGRVFEFRSQSWPAGGRSCPLGRNDQWAVEPDVGRVAHGVPARVDRLRGLGNAVVPQVAEWLGRRIMEIEGGAKW
jgi:DNA (cytosine-5)-methyltransferase 1